MTSISGTFELLPGLRGLFGDCKAVNVKEAQLLLHIAEETEGDALEEQSIKIHTAWLFSKKPEELNRQCNPSHESQQSCGNINEGGLQTTFSMKFFWGGKRSIN